MKNIIKIIMMTLSLLTYKNVIYACNDSIMCVGTFKVGVRNSLFNNIGTGNKILKNNGLIIGNENKAGENTTIIGNNNIVKGENNYVLGNNITEDETVKNSIILGNGSKGESNTLSIGSKGNERRIINVSKGIKDTDAVNLGQLKEYVNNVTNIGVIREEIKKSNANLSAGIALSMAMSSIPQVGQNKLVSIGFGSSYYNKQAGFALGVSGTEAKNIFVYKLNIGMDTRKNFGVSVGFNINFVNKFSNVKIIKNTDNEILINEKIRQLDDKLNKINMLERALENLMYPTDFVLTGFGINKSNITDIQKQMLLNIISKINMNTKIKTLKIVGYSDTRGDDKYNLELGLKRARNVANELYQLGLNKNIKINTSSTGFNTIVENGLESANRRVEIKAY